MKLKSLLIAIAVLLSATHLKAQQEMQFKVGDTARTAIVYIPKTAVSKSSPVIFAFHGHGGKALAFFNKCHFEKLWPEAIIIFPQGLNTPGSLTDPEGKRTRWQNVKGKMGDRDLAFFDVMLAELQSKYKVNDQQIYATGHSNGGGFTYLLYAERGNVFAAVAPSASVAGLKVGQLKPKPVMHIMGDDDHLVKSANQLLTIERLKKINKTAASGEKTGAYSICYKSAIGSFPVITYIVPGGHIFPKGAEVEIIKFFKANRKP